MMQTPRYTRADVTSNPIRQHRHSQWLNCPATGGGSLSLKLLDYTFVRLWEKFRTSI